MSADLNLQRLAGTPADRGASVIPINLERGQLEKLAHAISVAVTESLAQQHAIGRSSYSLAEVACRAGVSEAYVREDVRRGLLRVVRPGGRDVARVLLADEGLWLQGRMNDADPPVEGLSPRTVRRNTLRSIAAGVLRKGRREHSL